MRVIILWFKRQRKLIIISTVKFKRAFKRERKETVIAAKILSRLLKDENSVSREEIKFLKSQTVDIGKAVGLLGLQFIPGSSLGIIALEKLGRKKGFTVFPKEHEIPKSTSEDSSS